MKVLLGAFLLSILILLTRGTVAFAQTTISVFPQSSAPGATVSASLSSAISTVP